MCKQWGDANHTYFQIANLFLAFTYFVPSTLKGLLVLRLFLGTAGLFFAIWAGVVICAPDTLAWNLAFILFNYGHGLYMLYSMRSIKFVEEHEILFGSLFEQLGVARYEYKDLADVSEVVELRKGQVYAHENETDGENIAILTNGSVRVMRNGILLHRLKPYEFLDSPEWIASTQGNMAAPVTFQVTLISDGCTIITWKRSLLLRTMRKRPQLKNIFDSLIGQDVARKLFKSQDKPSTYGSTNNDGGIGGIDNIVYNVPHDSSENLLPKEEKEGSIRLEIRNKK